MIGNTMLSALDLEARHVDTLGRMTPAQHEAIGIETGVAHLVASAALRGRHLSRRDALTEVFQLAEAATAAGLDVGGDWFLPLAKDGGGV
jgi:hypothetical protein